MAEELLALEANRTWDLVPRPSDGTVIGSKWIYSIKVKPDGSLDRYKARLVEICAFPSVSIAHRQLVFGLTGAYPSMQSSTSAFRPYGHFSFFRKPVETLLEFETRRPSLSV